jgi:hypothetical protein
MRNRIDQPVGDLAGGVGAALTGIGILVMVLFPFAVPALLLTVALAAPLVLPVAVLAVAAALVTGPLLAIRAIARRVARTAGLRVTFGRARGSSLQRPMNETQQWTHG